MEKFNTTLFTSYNSVMEGYIGVTDDMLKDREHVTKLLNESYDYMMNLEPK